MQLMLLSELLILIFGVRAEIAQKALGFNRKMLTSLLRLDFLCY